MVKLILKFLYRTKIFILSLLLLFASLFLDESFFQNDNPKLAKISTQVINSVTSQNLLANMPLRFIPNKGQAGNEAEYHVQAAGHTVLFHDEKIVLRREEAVDKKNEIVLEFMGANKNPIIKGNEKLSGVANFFKGSDPSKWKTNLPTFSSIIYEDLYPGIDMAYIGDEGRLESEFYVSPNTDYRKIKLNYTGIISKRIRDDGALMVETELGELVEKAPYAYQDIDSVREEIEAEYTLLADACIGFELGDYNHDFPVVIDPELAFISFIDHFSGGWVSAVTFDNVGNLVFAGASNRFFPATDVIDSSNHDGGLSDDGLLLKVDATTGEIIYSALFGGDKQDSFNDIAIDDLGNIYLVGMTVSKNFPILNALQDTIGGSHDAFLSILNSNGELTYSTYLGGSRTDWALDVVLDGTGNIFIAGRTVSPDFPVKNAFQDTISGQEKFGDYNQDIFLAKVNSTGDLSYATYLGGSLSDRLEVIAVNNSGELTVTGSTDSHDFPLMNAYQDSNTTILNWESAMIITRLNNSGNGLIYSTYFGGGGNDWANGIDLTDNGETYISGGTTSEDFPIINGASFPEADSSDGVLIRLDNSGQPIFSLRSNVSGYDFFNGIARQNDSTLLFMSQEGDSLRIYEKIDDSFFEEIFSFNSEGHSINDIGYGDGSLAFASTYWGTGLGKTASIKKMGSIDQRLSFARVGFGLIRITENDCLEIKMESAGELKIDVDENGIVTVNSESIGVKAADVKCIIVHGSDGDDEIDLSGVTDENFTNINDYDDVTQVRYINILGKEGDDIITASLDHSTAADGGKGNDIILGGNKSDFLNGNDGDDKIDGGLRGDIIWGGKGSDILFGSAEADVLSADGLDKVVGGGEGHDAINFIKIISLPRNSNLINDQASNNKVSSIMIENVVTITDSSGIDTLNFSEYNSGITLDITLLNAEQTIDTAGTQILLQGIFEIVVGSEFDDEITISPLADTARHVDGRDGIDILNFNAEIPGSVDNGSTITTPGYADVTYINLATVNLSVVTGTEEAVDESLPISFGLGNNYPNPFNPSTSIKYSIPIRSHVTLIVFDVLGNELQTLFDKEQSSGNYEIKFDGLELTSGIYFYRLQAGNFVETKKMILLK